MCGTLLLRTYWGVKRFVIGILSTYGLPFLAFSLLMSVWKYTIKLMPLSNCLLIYPVLSSIQEKGSDEIVFKAMGRAINKTVTIVELIKVFIVLYIVIFLFFSLLNLFWWSFWHFLITTEKNSWFASDHNIWVHWYHWYMGANRGRPSSVRIFSICRIIVSTFSFALG